MITTRTRDAMGNPGRTRRGIIFGKGEPQKNFVCDICNEELPNNHKLLSHKRRHNITAVINYSENSNDGNTIEDENKDVTRDTEAIGFRCEQCEKVLPTRKGLFLHGIKMHKKHSLEAKNKLEIEPALANEIPKQLNEGLQELQFIKNVDIPKSENNIFQVKLVKMKSKTVNSKENGIKIKLVKKISSEFHCGTCGKTLNTRRGLILHEVRIHNRKREGLTQMRFKCHKCGEMFKSEQKVNRHDLKVHQQVKSGKKDESKGKIQCDKCWKRFSSQKGFIFHKAKVHGKKRKDQTDQTGARVYKCSYCIYATKLLINLHKHERIHLPEEQRKKLELAKVRNCHLCSYSTSDKSNFTKHLTQTHKMGNQRNCSFCPYQTFSRLGLNGHMKRRHQVNRAPSTTCFQCNIKFKSLYDLRCHRWKQMGLGKPCGDGKSLKKDNSLPPVHPKPSKSEPEKPRNIITHQSEQSIQSQILPLPIPQPLFLHQCQLCDKKFATKAFLKKHFNYVHDKSSDVQDPPENVINSEKEGPSENPKMEQEIDIVIKKEKDDTIQDFEIKQEEYLEDETTDLSTPSAQENKLLFKTDTPHLQCQLCFVVCWNEDALANHLKRHR